MKVDYVMKLGGSLLYDMQKTRIMLQRIDASKNHNTVYTIGSGYLGEVYKQWVMQENGVEMPFDNSIMTWSNIQSINANILAGINSNFVVCSDLAQVDEALQNGKRPVLDARGFHKHFEQEEYANQTTDVRSAIMCHVLGCKQLIIVTDVDGIYSSDPKKDSNTQRIKRINASELRKMGRTSVDKGLADKLIQYGITGYVVGIDSIVKEKEMSQESLEDAGTVIEH